MHLGVSLVELMNKFKSILMMIKSTTKRKERLIKNKEQSLNNYNLEKN